MYRAAVGFLLVVGFGLGCCPIPSANAACRLRVGQAMPVETAPVAMHGLYRGGFKQGFRWNDLNGENWLILTETGEFTPPGRKRRTDGSDEFRQAELYAYRFVNVNGVFSKAWQIKDFVRECPLDITAEFILPATEITDLDGNGIAEAWVMYKTACRGDVSPATLKIIMYENTRKYAMRGPRPHRVTGFCRRRRYDARRCFQRKTSVSSACRTEMEAVWHGKV